MTSTNFSFINFRWVPCSSTFNLNIFEKFARVMEIPKFGSCFAQIKNALIITAVKIIIIYSNQDSQHQIQ